MKQFLIQLVMMAAVFLLLWMIAPLLMVSIAQWPSWMKDSNIQFIAGLLLSLIAAFNPFTRAIVKNKARIKGNSNQVIQGGQSTKHDNVVHNTASIKGDHNKIKQG